MYVVVFFFLAEDGIRDGHVTGVQTCALPIFARHNITETRRHSRLLSITSADRTKLRRLRARRVFSDVVSGDALRDLDSHRARSEERRVGKECISRCSLYVEVIKS